MDNGWMIGYSPMSSRVRFMDSSTLLVAKVGPDDD